ncbi:Quinolinate synthetase A [Syntrophomonas zehnderi OL-4]|uniref:Quinolinate synthase n=1 Tax=Syntrophomonas zehnderi OL-4 TaxID=690567 RepID=A0A0E4C8F7_9FIRM|nr:quinolinate synthase NadA [Syntrophomonas zehnderi]CFX41739.1 Quinolinate synthetase A [Syntrophomonas zehnderi OL-4]
MIATNDRSLTEKILKLKEEKSIYIIAHYYQQEDIQDIADFIGDSYAMAVAAQKSPQDTILVAGVDFMAESAAILCPDKTVLTPEPKATCPMANSISVDEVLKFKEKYPNSIVMSYVNTPAEIKAVSDICCTSSNAATILKKLPDDAHIFFIPDQNLALNTASNLSRNVNIYDSDCPVHAALKKTDIEKLKEKYPDAKVLVHPECIPDVVKMADYVGSTSGIINYVNNCDQDTFIIATESGVTYPIRQANPDKKLIMASENMICPDMKSITLQKIYDSLKNRETVIKVPENIRLPAAQALEKMIAYTS